MSTIPPSWRLQEFLQNYPTMAIVPTSDRGVCIRGDLREPRAGPDGTVLHLDYRVEMAFPLGFPHRLPSVRELGGRIARSFHRLGDGSLCLGSRLRLLVQMREEPTVEGFFEGVVVPYLYGHAYKQEHGDMPWGELRHETPGLLDDYCEMLGFDDAEICRQALVLLGYRRRLANKRPCFCGSGVRLGRCHSQRLNSLRRLASCSQFRAAVADMK